ncbi:MAG: aminotransferase class V-fold PLP-dependent enzyme [SAR202 cluster bacterium]|nr:aminotransferase class V-fold PLP-dependent enzyme [SAR202 cluster bacterium]
MAKIDGLELYRKIGVKPVISAAGTTTLYGGTKARPEVMEVMAKTSNIMVNIDELNKAAGKVLAKYTGAEAGLVTSGSGGGLVLQAAAVIAGADPKKMVQLPDASGLKNEIIIHKSHRFAYDQLYRAAGAKFVEIGDGRRCYPWQLEAAFTERTAAVAYLFAAFVSQRALPLEQVCEIAHKRGVPVIVDAASTLPPRANLRKFIAQGADLVQFSGGKGIRGPQGTGILVGRSDLIEAAFANGSPHQFLGRGLKVAKEEIMGLLTALEIFVNEDEAAETNRYTEMCRRVVDALIEIPGIKVSVEHDGHSYHVPTALIEFTHDWKGPSRDTIMSNLDNGDPHIYLHRLGDPDELAVEPINLDDQELEIVIRRLREEMLKPVKR